MVFLLFLPVSMAVAVAQFAAGPVVGIILWLITRLAQKAFRILPSGPKALPILGDRDARNRLGDTTLGDAMRAS